MDKHSAKYPQAKIEYEAIKITERQAARLAGIADVSAKELIGRSIRDLLAKAELGIDPYWLFGRRICGRVVKMDAGGNNLPVPFATVNIYDTDVSGAFWSPPGGIESWFYPLRTRKELIGSVITDECGRFCVRIPRFDIDWILRFRKERHCYLEWLRKPSIRDILERYKVVPPHIGPDPDPGPLRLDDHLLKHAARVLDDKQVEKLRIIGADAIPGVSTSAAAAFLDAERWPASMPATLPKELRKSLLSGNRDNFRTLTGIPEKLAQAFDPRRVFGPFLRCHWHIVPEWHTVIDVPDVTFEVTQDVNGDGVQDVIYSEGLFDVRWNTGTIPDVELVASPNAIASVTCGNPIIGPCGDPAILFAGNYELQQPGSPLNGHDRGTGYALIANVPRIGGNPGGTRLEPGAAPFRSNFYLWGCCERPGANRYRVTYEFFPITPGPTVKGVLSNSSWTLAKLVGGVVQYRPVSDEGGWYPIVPRAEGWTPSGLLALVPGGLPPGRYDFRLEFGNAAGTNVTFIPKSESPTYAIQIDDTPPANPGITQVLWRHSVLDPWTPLPLGHCPVIARTNNGALEFQIRFSTAAFHLRDATIRASGCGPGAAPIVSNPSIPPGFFHPGSSALPDLSAIQHWHDSASDNSVGGTVIYTLAQNAPAGCYDFEFTAVSRAIDCNQPYNNSANQFWHLDPTVISSRQRVTISIQ